MARNAAIILVSLGILAAAGTARAQTAARRLSIFGVAGAGTFGDDEGNLGGGFVGGGGVGIELSRGVRVEMAVATTHHERLPPSPGKAARSSPRDAWSGSSAIRRRACARSRAPAWASAATRARGPIRSAMGPAAASLGDCRVHRERLGRRGGWRRRDQIGRGVFIRPEAWLAMMGGDRTQGLEPAFTMPRADVSVGFRF